MAATETEEWVSGDGWISDDSSFYGSCSRGPEYMEDVRYSLAPAGDEAQRAALEQTARDSEGKWVWRLQPSFPAWENRRAGHASLPDNGALNFPMEGNQSARQSTETVEEFVKRLPPSKANVWDHGEWLWVHNPNTSPGHDDGDVEALMAVGKKLLDDFLQFKTKVALEVPAKSNTAIARRLTPRRNELVEGLRKAAVDANYKCGKWMLFPSLSEVDGVWQTVARGVVDGRLGIAAKVATANLQPAGSDRLICVYTHDFGDLKDVRRVLNALVDMGLVNTGPGARGIWYKCDAYTVLGLSSGNDYGVRASLYGSKDMLE